MTALLAGLCILAGADELEVSARKAATPAGSTSTWVEVTLQNRSKGLIRIWSPNNVEGGRSIFIELSRPGRPAVLYQAPVPPRAAGIPTATLLAPGSKLVLPLIEISVGSQKGQVPSGPYRAVAVYRNALSQRGPVTKVWTGEARSKPFSLSL